MIIHNPFTSPSAQANSNYLMVTEEDKVIDLSSRKVKEVDEYIFRKVRGLIENDQFPCLAAKSALNTYSYRIGIYSSMADEHVNEGLAQDLIHFLNDAEAQKSGFATFISVFKSPKPASEREFEALLWKQLRMLKELSEPQFNWDNEVSDDPDDADFGFSFGGKAFFVVGMHARSSRLARRSPWPLLVFNLHSQFKTLKEEGKFLGLRDAIRQRDKEFQGFENPMLSDFGEASEARQYSGRAVDENWECPFHSTKNGNIDEANNIQPDTPTAGHFLSS